MSPLKAAEWLAHKLSFGPLSCAIGGKGVLGMGARPGARSSILLESGVPMYNAE